MLFEGRFRTAISDGSITVTFRRWKRAQVVAGRRYRTAAGIIEVNAVDIVDPGSISAVEARRAGYASRAELLAGLGDTEGRPLYRVGFRSVSGPDPRDRLAATNQLSDHDVAEIDRRLDRLDRASSHGPWTRPVLAIIADRPGVRAADLATDLGRERAPFKLDVRKLKALGLTLSLEIGYRLSPRGEAYRAAAAPAQRAIDGT